jgi:GNAT superfamily N-acetyltransferase
MNTPETPVSLKMVRWNLEHIPQFALPEGFALRWYQPGDEQAWLKIHLAADRFNSITPGLFAQQFGADPVLLGQRQCYLLADHGELIGTGTAWFNDDFQGQPFGRVHWVALLPRYQGLGLSKPLMTALCQRLRELGHERAYLSTSSARLAAINLYRRFGFVPFLENDGQAEVWRRMGL